MEGKKTTNKTSMRKKPGWKKEEIKVRVLLEKGRGRGWKKRDEGVGGGVVVSVPVPLWRFQSWRDGRPFCLCLVLQGAVGVLHLSCVLFALGGLPDGARGLLADVCMQSGYTRKRKFIYRYIALYVDS